MDKYTIVSHWKKPGSRWVQKEDGTGFREKTGKTMAMVIMEVNGKKVTRHIAV